MLRCLAGALLLILGANMARGQQVSFGDHCFLTPWSDLSDPDSQVIPVDIPADCPTGEIDWNYPTGSLRLTATSADRSKPFTFCIGETWATAIGAVHEVTSGLNNQLSLPTTDNPTCIESQNGVAELLVTAESTLYYMTGFSFSVIDTA